MTDRERLLIALLSAGGDEVEGPVTSVEVMAILEELGREHRRQPSEAPARLSA